MLAPKPNPNPNLSNEKLLFKKKEKKQNIFLVRMDYAWIFLWGHNQKNSPFHSSQKFLAFIHFLRESQRRGLK